jgi:hypothetical protein
MPKQKDLKRIVRSRMEKTGESYTAARLQVTQKKEPAPDYAAVAGMSDAAVKKATGRNWREWLKTLDAVRAMDKPHREIAEYVSSIGTPDWWTQMVTVGYERLRGLRDRGQRRDGLYEANKSRTFAVAVSQLYKAFADGRLRGRWLPGVVKASKGTLNKTMRITMDDETTVQLSFIAKGDTKSVVAIQHQQLRDKSTAEKMKAWWTERLAALSEVLS